MTGVGDVIKTLVKDIKDASNMPGIIECPNCKAKISIYKFIISSIEYNDLLIENEKLKQHNLELEAGYIDWERIGNRNEQYQRGDAIYAMRDELKERVDKLTIEEIQKINEILNKNGC